MDPTARQSSYDRSPVSGGPTAGALPDDARVAARIEQLPREVGALILTTGMVTGMLPPPPGPFDVSLMVAGGVALWPRGLKTLDRWALRRFPRARRAAMCFLDRYLDDLERRCPGATRGSASRQLSSLAGE
jgi:hypothetical protein